MRADSRLLAIHTKAGGARRLTLPANQAARDAISGQPLGEGPTLDLQLPPNSTTILELTDVNR